jgi:hypothetical protein
VESRTSSLFHSVQFIAQYQPWIAVGPPDFQPVDKANEWVDSGMHSQTKLVFPFIMLINSPHIIHPGSPETFAPKSIFTPLSDQFRLINREVFSDQIPSSIISLLSNKKQKKRKKENRRTEGHSGSLREIRDQQFHELQPLDTDPGA